MSFRLLDRLVADLLVAAGTQASEADDVARVLGWAERRGLHPQGCVWVDILTQRLVAGTIRTPAPLEVVADRPAAVVLDAGDGLGQVAGLRAVDLAAERAVDTGVGLVTIRSSNHFGPAGFYADALARRGLVAVVATNAYPKVAPPGGASKGLGTNPLALGAPVADEPPLVADVSTGALAGSKVRDAIAEGARLPEGQLLDADGRPTTDPHALGAGGVMLPAGGHKGFAFGLLVEVLTSVLGGGHHGAGIGSMFDTGRRAATSHAVLAIAPHDDGVPDRLASLAAWLRSTGSEVRLPGQRAATLADGRDDVELPAASLAALRAAADRVDVPMPEPLNVSRSHPE